MLFIDFCLTSNEQAISAVVMTKTNQGSIAAFCSKSKKSTGFSKVPRFIVYHSFTGLHIPV